MEHSEPYLAWQASGPKERFEVPQQPDHRDALLLIGRLPDTPSLRSERFVLNLDGQLTPVGPRHHDVCSALSGARALLGLDSETGVPNRHPALDQRLGLLVEQPL
jgi:hypothetical protein